MTIIDLIKHLQTFPQNLPVAYSIHSEQCLLAADDIRVKELCVARDDGWIQDRRPDMHSMAYLVFP